MMLLHENQRCLETYKAATVETYYHGSHSFKPGFRDDNVSPDAVGADIFVVLLEDGEAG